MSVNLFTGNFTLELYHGRVSAFSGLEYWNGVLEWSTGIDYWTGVLDWSAGGHDE
jgi:hypothetical protein